MSIRLRGLCSARGGNRLAGAAMYRFIKGAGILALGIVSLGAAPQGESATLIMSKGYDKGAGFGTATLQDYYLLPDGLTCHHKKRLAGLSLFSGTSVTKSVPAGTPLNIFTAVQRIVGYSTGVCQNNVTFTPLPSHTYTVVQRTVVWGSCQIEVVDTATNGAPVDLTQDNSLECIRTRKPGE